MTIDVNAIVKRLAQATEQWHQPSSDTGTPDLILQLHRANFDLWHQEDHARDPNATDSEIAQVKHSIDTINQLRNDTVEQIDRELLTELARHNLPVPQAPLHSETPGLILDRLSILALKIFHTREETARADTSTDHRDRNQQRLQLLQQQSNDLALCLAELWSDILNGHRRFKLYLQLKMYNDPSLNPVLYKATNH